MSIKRFSKDDACNSDVCDSRYGCDMHESLDGEYVLFEDYRAIEAKLKEIRKQKLLLFQYMRKIGLVKTLHNYLKNNK